MTAGRSTPLARFWLLNSARQDAKHRRPGGDILPQLGRIDLVERVVRRVVQIEIANAVLAEAYARQPVFQHRPNVRPIRLGKGAGDNAKRSQSLADRFRFCLAGIAELAVDLPDLVRAEIALDQRVMRLLAIFG